VEQTRTPARARFTIAIAAGVTVLPSAYASEDATPESGWQRAQSATRTVARRQKSSSNGVALAPGGSVRTSRARAGGLADRQRTTGRRGSSP
jgi:hypothetical protein